jgi:MoaA/NifB/PqqE/SkfB family radical SAM enzyme
MPEPLRDITPDEVRRVVDQLPALQRVALHGVGEPLLNPHLTACIEYLKQRANAPHVLFNSNALLLTPRWQAALIASGLDEFRISIDAAHADLYARIRGVDGFDRVTANVAAFARRVARAGGGPRLSLWFTAMQTNLSELPDLVQLAHRLGVGEVYVQRLVLIGQGLARDAESPYRSLEAAEQAQLTRAEELADALDIRFCASGATSPRSSLLPPEDGRRPWSHCNRPRMLMYITANGNVLPCCIAPFSSHNYASIILGNVFERPLAEIWDGVAYQRLRAALQSDAPWECCDRCGVSWSL